MQLKDPGLIKFEAKLFRPEGSGTGTFFNFPYNVLELFGTKGNVKVEITLDDFKYRGLLANMGGPYHCIGVRKEIRDIIKKDAGDEVKVKIKLDTKPRIVEIPSEIKKLLSKYPSEETYFEQLSYSHQKEYVEWLTSAKKEETRVARLEKFIQMLKTKQKLK